MPSSLSHSENEKDAFIEFSIHAFYRLSSKGLHPGVSVPATIKAHCVAFLHLQTRAFKPQWPSIAREESCLHPRTKGSFHSNQLWRLLPSALARTYSCAY